MKYICIDCKATWPDDQHDTAMAHGKDYGHFVSGEVTMAIPSVAQSIIDTFEFDSIAQITPSGVKWIK